MSINFISTINKPSEIKYVACSGGIDSMTLLCFLLEANYKPTILHFDHDTVHGQVARNFVTEFCSDRNLITKVNKIQGHKPNGVSTEEWWRTERYKFFNQFEGPIATAHHLDDALETYLFTTVRHGKSELIPIKRDQFVRPLLTTTKNEIINWADRYNVPHVHDESNYDVKYPRNRIRHNIMPEILQVNPGFHKVIKKMYLEQVNEYKRSKRDTK